jgi:hypothetical protein
VSHCQIADSHCDEYDVMWDVTRRSLVEVNRRFRDAYSLH